jgi:hypothetical protein
MHLCQSIGRMRITLDIDDDVLRAARELARREKKTVGRVISDLARQALDASPVRCTREVKALQGFRPCPRRGRVVTNELIDRMRGADAY